MRHAACLLVLFAMLFFLSFPSHAENRALLVGCDDFTSMPSTWPASADNVVNVSSALSGVIHPSQMVTIPDGILDGEALHSQLLQLGRDMTNEDVLWFYISTHGLYDSRHGFRILLSNGWEEQEVSASQLRLWFDDIPGHKVLIFDCCHSGAAIGKGLTAYARNTFVGSDYTVICSSGGAEESWFWTDPESSAGSGYFSSALCSGLTGQLPADTDRDGIITLSELRRYLRENHGASTCQTYPEESSMPLVVYDVDAVSDRISSPLKGLTFWDSVMTGSDPYAAFSFTLTRRTRLAYQLVLASDERWDFSSGRLFWDAEAEDGQALEPGYRERTLYVDRLDAESSGYVLVQLLRFTQHDRASVLASHVLCVPPQTGDPALKVTTSGTFCPEAGEELNIHIRHSLPCELSLTIEDLEGNTIRWLSGGDASRPQEINGTTICWTGLLADGTVAQPGLYRLRAKTTIGTTTYEAISGVFALTDAVG